MKSKHLAAVVLAAFALGAGAQTLKPGLWEVTHKMQGAHMDAMAQMQQQMAKMPPEQRKMMEEAMARQGVKIGAGGPGGGMSMKVCMTREMIDKNELGEQRPDCKTTKQSRSGNTLKTAFVCTNPPSSGEGQFTYNSSEAYTMKVTATSQIEGQSQKVDMEGSGKWLGADCGAVKPMALPARK